MLDALKQSISDLHKVYRPSLEDECNALFVRIDEALRTGGVTDDQATQLIYDVRNERSRCFRNGSRRRIEDSEAS